MTKKEVSAIATKYGCEANYQGDRKTMFIHGQKANEALEAIRKGTHSFAVREHINYSTSC